MHTRLRFLPFLFLAASALPATAAPLPDVLVPPTMTESDARDGLVDVAWDAETRRFCLVWERQQPSGVEFVTQTFEEDGSPVTDPRVIGSSVVAGRAPAICNLADDGLFVIAFSAKFMGITDYVALYATKAADPWSSSYTLLPTPGLRQLDIGGDPIEGYEQVCLVWNDAGGIRGQRVHFERLHEVEPGQPFTISEGEPYDNSFPRISQSNGPAGNWLVVWENSSVGFSAVHTAVVDREGFVGPVQSWSAHAHLPSCDGSGNRFLISYLAGFGHEIHGLLVEVGPGKALTFLGIDVLHKNVTYSLSRPQVAISSNGLDNAWTVAWGRAASGGTYHLQYRSFDDALQPISVITDLATQMLDVRIASLRSADFFSLFVGEVALGIGRTFGVYYAVVTP